MQRREHLLWVLAEECAEVAHRASKAARFGLNDIQPGQAYTNAQLLVQEYMDLQAAMELLVADGHVALPNPAEAIAAKKAKVEKFLLYSDARGTLTPNSTGSTPCA